MNVSRDPVSAGTETIWLMSGYWEASGETEEGGRKRGATESQEKMH